MVDGCRIIRVASVVGRGWICSLTSLVARTTMEHSSKRAKTTTTLTGNDSAHSASASTVTQPQFCIPFQTGPSLERIPDDVLHEIPSHLLYPLSPIIMCCSGTARTLAQFPLLHSSGRPPFVRSHRHRDFCGRVALLWHGKASNFVESACQCASWKSTRRLVGES